MSMALAAFAGAIIVPSLSAFETLHPSAGRLPVSSSGTCGSAGVAPSSGATLPHDAGMIRHLNRRHAVTGGDHAVNSPHRMIPTPPNAVDALPRRGGSP